MGETSIWVSVRDIDLDVLAGVFHIERDSVSFARRTPNARLYIAKPREDGSMQTPRRAGEECEVCGDEMDGDPEPLPGRHQAGCGRDVELSDSQWDRLRKYLILVSTFDVGSVESTEVPSH